MTDDFIIVAAMRNKYPLDSADQWEAENRRLTDDLRRMREALEYIAESHDAGGLVLPWPCPAHDEYEMWAIALDALSAIDQTR